MSNSKLDIEISCMMWNNAREKENKWKIVDDASGAYSMVPDLTNIKVENNTICIDDEKKDAYRVVDGKKQVLDYKKASETRNNRKNKKRTIHTVPNKNVREDNVI